MGARWECKDAHCSTQRCAVNCSVGAHERGIGDLQLASFKQYPVLDGGSAPGGFDGRTGGAESGAADNLLYFPLGRDSRMLNGEEGGDVHDQYNLHPACQREKLVLEAGRRV